jgi:hypothetical protein
MQLNGRKLRERNKKGAELSIYFTSLWENGFMGVL